MGLFDLTDTVLERALVGSSLRQSVLANNLANANTPGYRRSDVDFQSALADALDEPAVSRQDAVSDLSFSPKADADSPQRADGNTVDVDAEMAKLSENAVGYQALVAVAHARLAMIQTAIGGR